MDTSRTGRRIGPEPPNTGARWTRRTTTNTRSARPTECEDLRLPCVDHGGDDQGEKGDVTKAVPTSYDEQGGREQPAGPREHCGVRPAQPSDHRTAQLEDGAGEDACQRAQLQHAAQCVHAGSGDDQGEDRPGR